MRINDDLTRPVFVDTTKLEWVPSPASGVERRMLFRVGDEVARATSIVRYAPESAFPRHVHGGGEEILVLEGTFQDEHGDYPAGTYFRNPPGTSHVPAAKDGCTIFVRLWQFREGDDMQIVCRPGEGHRDGLCGGASEAIVLFDDGHEEVRIEIWQPGATASIENERGLEFLVLAGTATINGETLGPHSWGRLPSGVDLTAKVGPEEVRIWLKHAPLLHPDVLEIPAPA